MGPLQLLQRYLLFLKQVEYALKMLESVHKVVKTKISVRYVMVDNIVNILMGPLQIALSCLLLMNKSQMLKNMLESVNEVVKTKISMYCKFCDNFHGSIANLFWHCISDHFY